MKSIHFDIKTIQQLRVLNFHFYGVPNPANVLKESKRYLEKMIRNHISLKYYVDIALGIEEVWKGHAIEDTRRFDNNWEKFDKEILPKDTTFIDWPSVLVFTSSPNEEADRQIRAKLSEDIILKDGKAIGVKVQSRRAFRKIFFDQEKFKENKKEEWKKKELYLLLFQIKSAVQSVFTENPDLFKSVKIGLLNPICWGLLVGDIDGFVLYSQESGKVKEIIEEKVKELLNLDKFLTLLIPSRLYLVSADRIFYNNAQNFIDVWQSIGCKNFSEWKNLW